jgi:CDP-diacylglycerol--glycerol-3-phosphate 3-phosphatidyltransferase
MNLPNQLTLARIIMIPFFLLFLLWGELGIVADSPDELWLITLGRYLALIIFTVASLTDWLDGKIARARGLVTNFGRLMDPLADKLLIMAAYVAFVELGYFPAWVVIIILAREFAVTGLRQLAIEQGRVIQADRWGKNKTIAQIVTAFATLIALCIRDTMRWLGMWDELTPLRKEMEWWMDWTILVLMACVVFFTLASGYRYITKNWDIVMPNEEEENA